MLILSLFFTFPGISLWLSECLEDFFLITSICCVLWDQSSAERYMEHQVNSSKETDHWEEPLSEGWIDFNFVCNFCNQFLKQEPHEFLGTMKQEGTLLLKGKKHWQSSSLDFYQICFCSFLLWYWGFCTSAGLREGTQVFKGMKSSLEFLLLIEFNHCSVLVLYLLYP